MVWGCITAQGAGYATRIDGKMDSPLYVSILEDELIKTMEFFNLNNNDIVFQQDNDPKHTYRLARKWFKDNKIELLNRPAQSPDLIPIEHLWYQLKQRLAAYKEEPSSIHELWERIEVQWDKITPEQCLILIESMPRRVIAVIKAKYGNKKY